ncbi:Uncharacterised protein [Mycobacteroides abscessus subsp. abscessus]|nr:Uncharacterised protein [Mycobacteroides abscessus subsp. abscessus]
MRLGTKCPSITSTCSQSAPSTAAISSARRAKSADRIEGAIMGARCDMSFSLCAPSCVFTQEGGEHRVSAVPVRP